MKTHHAVVLRNIARTIYDATPLLRRQAGLDDIEFNEINKILNSLTSIMHTIEYKTRAVKN